MVALVLQKRLFAAQKSLSTYSSSGLGTMLFTIGGDHANSSSWLDNEKAKAALNPPNNTHNLYINFKRMNKMA